MKISDIFYVDDYFAAVKDGIAITTDGVGSKIKLAEHFNDYTTIGIDCVAMNVNDLLCVGAKPICMVDYITLPKMYDGILKEMSLSLRLGCREADIPLLGGETAIIEGHSIDLSGTAIGTVETILDGSTIEKGDYVYGFPSNGLHANGFTDAMKVLKLSNELLEPTVIYTDHVKGIKDPKAIIHITGGGWDNIYRVKRKIEVRWFDWVPPPLFEDLQDKLDWDTPQMYSTFNMGIGMMVICKDRPEGSVLLGEIINE